MTQLKISPTTMMYTTLKVKRQTAKEEIDYDASISKTSTWKDQLLISPSFTCQTPVHPHERDVTGPNWESELVPRIERNYDTAALQRR
jgi:hypothetical protein